MDDREYLRSVAQRCLDLSSRCYHLEVAGKLRTLGNEIMARNAAKGTNGPEPGNAASLRARPKLDARAMSSRGMNGARAGRFILLTDAVRQSPFFRYCAAAATRARAALHRRSPEARDN
jgi:hypothetical protein